MELHCAIHGDVSQSGMGTGGKSGWMGLEDGVGGGGRGVRGRL